MIIFKNADELREKLLLNFDKNYGEIKRFEPIKLDRKFGYLIWDFNGFNEITFVDENAEDYLSMFASINIRETDSCFKSIFERYKINE